MALPGITVRSGWRVATERPISAPSKGARPVRLTLALLLRAPDLVSARRWGALKTRLRFIAGALPMRLWRYMAKDAHRSPNVAAVDQFRKTVEQAEKEAQKPSKKGP